MCVTIGLDVMVYQNLELWTHDRRSAVPWKVDSLSPSGVKRIGRLGR